MPTHRGGMTAGKWPAKPPMQTRTKAQILQLIAQTAKSRARILVAISGPPGSGKSTLAHELATQLADCAAVPMDGFHLSNDELAQKGLLHRKGAPETFDAEGFATLIRSLRSDNAITYPIFDRSQDKTIPNGAILLPSVRIVLVEGNYLLLNAPPWNSLAAEFDLTISLVVPQAVLKQRLVQRWLDQGLSPQMAAARANGNDMKNAILISQHAIAPDVTLVPE